MAKPDPERPSVRTGRDTVRADGVPPLGNGNVVGRPQPRAGLRRARAAAAGDTARAELAGHLGLTPTALAALDPADVATALAHVQAAAGRVVELEGRATVDDLTGVLRRGAGTSCLRAELARARRHSLPMVVAFIDVDGLKAVNDRDGHAAGDAALRVVAGSLRRGVRSYDCVMRYGGDEFVCGLLGADRRDARRLLDFLGAEIAARAGGVTVSVGLADVLTGDDDVDAVIARADAALLGGRARSGRRASQVTTPS